MSYKTVYIFFCILWVFIFSTSFNTITENKEARYLIVIKDVDTVSNWHTVKISRDIINGKQGH